jgi:transketolase
MSAQLLLDARGVSVNVVSIPCSMLFDSQDTVYRDDVLGRDLPRIGVEGGVTGWWSHYGCTAVLPANYCGQSAPGATAFQHCDLNASRLADMVQVWCDEERNIVRSNN